MRLIFKCFVLLILLPNGSIQMKAIPITRQSIERLSPINGDRFMVNTLTAIISRLE